MAFLDRTGLERLWLHIVTKLGGKVDKEDGKGLSSNDFTTEEKEKLARLQETVQIDIDNALNSTSENPVQNKVINSAIEARVNKAGDTMGGKLVANATSVATLGTAQVRNIWAGTANISEVEGSLKEGDIYLQYEEG